MDELPVETFNCLPDSNTSSHLYYGRPQFTLCGKPYTWQMHGETTIRKTCPACIATLEEQRYRERVIAASKLPPARHVRDPRASKDTLCGHLYLAPREITFITPDDKRLQPCVGCMAVQNYLDRYAKKEQS